MKGFIKVDRSLFASEMWRERRKFSRFEAWLDIVQRAAYKGTEGVNAGEVKLSTRKTAAAWGWPKTNVNRFIANLVDCGMLAKTDRQSVYKIAWDTKRDTKRDIKDTENQTDTQERGTQNAPKSGTSHLLYYKKDINKKGGVCSSHTPTPATEEEVTDRQWQRFDGWRWQNIPYMANRIDRPMYATMLALAKAAGKTPRDMANAITEIYYHNEDGNILEEYKRLISQ